MKNPKFTHIIVDIHSSDGYFEDKEKMIGMKIGSVDLREDVNDYGSIFCLSDKDNATLDLGSNLHNFVSAKITPIPQTEREDIKQRLARTGDEDLIDDAMEVRAGW